MPWSSLTGLSPDTNNCLLDCQVLWNSVLKGQSHAEAWVDVCLFKLATGCHAACYFPMLVTATTRNAMGACRGTSGAGLRITAVVTKPILTPLKDVARHVEQPQLVGSLAADGMGTEVKSAVVAVALTVIAEPTHVRQRIAARVHIAIAHVSATGCKLPLGLGGKADGSARQLVQPCDKFLAVAPGDSLNN